MDEWGEFLSSDGYTFDNSYYREMSLRRLTIDLDDNLRAYSWDNNFSERKIVWKEFK